VRELGRPGKVNPKLEHARFDGDGRLVWYKRWNYHHRLQHFLLMFGFGGLVLTGWPLKFAESPASKVLMFFMGGVKGAGILHRFCGVLLIAVSIYHVVFLAYEFWKGKRSTEMLPKGRDFKDVWDNMLFFIGLKKRPKFARYNYIEKFEYWAVVWGNSVMILTGLVLWFPVFAQHYLPEWTFPASVLLHDYEALLAALAIVIWHLFNVHLHPAVFPQNPVWLTGIEDRESMEHHHADELHELETAWRAYLASGGVENRDQAAPSSGPQQEAADE
jgi:cytochrome b subunit of formate dehydrogenase